jgi:hypothetical protein
VFSVRYELHFLNIRSVLINSTLRRVNRVPCICQCQDSSSDIDVIKRFS